MSSAIASGAASTGIDNWTFYLAFSFFRLAAICQGVYKRALDGNASNPEKARTYGEAVRLLSRLAVELIDKAERLGDGAIWRQGRLVTGATGGFGRRTAERLAARRCAARPVAISIGDASTTLAAELDGETATLAGDVSDEALSETSSAGLDTLRLGSTSRSTMPASSIFVHLPRSLDSDEARARDRGRPDGRVLRHEAPACRDGAAVPSRTAQGGAIVNIASVAGIAGAPRLSIYAAAKHGVVGLTRSAAVEYASKGIRVNAVCPSYARTPMATDALGTIAAGREGRRAPN